MNKVSLCSLSRKMQHGAVNLPSGHSETFSNLSVIVKNAALFKRVILDYNYWTRGRKSLIPLLKANV